MQESKYCKTRAKSTDGKQDVEGQGLSVGVAIDKYPTGVPRNSSSDRRPRKYDAGRRLTRAIIWMRQMNWLLISPMNVVHG